MYLYTYLVVINLLRVPFADAWAFKFWRSGPQSDIYPNREYGPLVPTNENVPEYRRNWAGKRVTEGVRACTLTNTLLQQREVEGIYITQLGPLDQETGFDPAEQSGRFRENIRYLGFWKKGECKGLPNLIIHFYNVDYTVQGFKFLKIWDYLDAQMKLRRSSGMMQETTLSPDDFHKFYAYAEIPNGVAEQLFENHIPEGSVALRKNDAGSPVETAFYWVLEDAIAINEVEPNSQNFVYNLEWENKGEGGPASVKTFTVDGGLDNELALPMLPQPDEWEILTMRNNARRAGLPGTNNQPQNNQVQSAPQSFWGQQGQQNAELTEAERIALVELEIQQALSLDEDTGPKESRIFQSEEEEAADLRQAVQESNIANGLEPVNLDQISDLLPQSGPQIQPNPRVQGQPQLSSMNQGAQSSALGSDRPTDIKKQFIESYLSHWNDEQSKYLTKLGARIAREGLRRVQSQAPENVNSAPPQSGVGGSTGSSRPQAVAGTNPPSMVMSRPNIPNMLPNAQGNVPMMSGIPNNMANNLLRTNPVPGSNQMSAMAGIGRAPGAPFMGNMGQGVPRFPTGPQMATTNNQAANEGLAPGSLIRERMANEAALKQQADRIIELDRILRRLREPHFDPPNTPNRGDDDPRDGEVKQEEDADKIEEEEVILVKEEAP
ncbi:hypothetical protein AA313_de0210334 [Arthrobotrys entomopaga]|nr:hypothetical protein AA313_de0210334 [Arthrobotrys entomopaga]